MRVSYIRIMLRVTVRKAKAKARAKGKENNQENTKSEGKDIDETQWKATAKAKGWRRHGEHQRKDLVRGQALREGLKERQNRDEENNAEEAKMEDNVHENAARKANAEGQGQWPKRTWHRRPKSKTKENAVRDAKTRGRRKHG